MTIIRSLLMKLCVGSSVFVYDERAEIERAAETLRNQYRRCFEIEDTEHGIRVTRLTNVRYQPRVAPNPSEKAHEVTNAPPASPSPLDPKDWRTKLMKLRVGQSLGFKYKRWDVFVGSIREFERVMRCSLDIEQVPDNYAYVTRRR